MAYIDRWKVYNRLVSSCTVKTAIEVQRLCVSTNKNGTFVGLLRLSLSFLVACAAINRVYLAIRTTIIGDTYLTLAAIPFKVDANNSLIFSPIQTYEKKFAEFPFLLVYNSLIHVHHRRLVSSRQVVDKELFRECSNKTNELDYTLKIWTDLINR